MARNPNLLHRDSLDFHQRVASFFADLLGSPYTIYVFALLALISLPAVWTSGNLTVIIAWITQTFIQLVALAVLQAKQVLDGRHSGIIANETHKNAQLAEQNAEEIKARISAVEEHLFDIKDSLKKVGDKSIALNKKK